MKLLKFHKMRLGLLSAGLTIAIAFVFQACVKEYHDYNKLSERVELDSRILAPVAHGEFTVKQLLDEFDNKNKIHIYEEGDPQLLYLVFDNFGSSDLGRQEFNISSRNYAISVDGNSHPGITNPSNWNTYMPQTVDTSLSLALDDARLDSLTLDTLRLEYEFNTSIAHTGEITITFPTLSPYGSSDPYSETIKISDTTGYDTVISRLLRNYSVDIQGTNDIPMKMTFDFTDEGNGVADSDSLRLEANLKDINYNGAFGYLGHDTLIAHDSIEINVDLFQTMENFNFEDPRLFFDVKNSYGVPVEMTFEDIYTYNESSGTRVDLSFKSGNTFSIGYPGFSEFGEYIDTLMAFNQSNVLNFAKAANSNPDHLYYDIHTVYNPDKTGNKKQFIVDTSLYKFTGRLELPFYGWTKNICIRDTIDFDFQEEYLDKFGDETTIIEQLKLKIASVNGIPATVKSQIYLTDSLFNKQDSIFVPGANNPDDYRMITKAAKMAESDFSIIEKSKNEVIISKKGEKIMNKWKDVKKMVICVYFDTFDAESQQNVKIRADQTFDIQVGVDVDYKASRRDIDSIIQNIDSVQN